MREEIRHLMDLLLRGIILDEGFARELSEVAHELEEDENTMSAEAMISLSRRHQVKGIRGRAQLTVLMEQYVRSFNDEVAQGRFGS